MTRSRIALSLITLALIMTSGALVIQGYQVYRGQCSLATLLSPVSALLVQIGIFQYVWRRTH